MSFSDLEGQEARGQMFPADLCNYMIVLFDDQITHGREGRVSRGGGAATPHPKWRAPTIPKFWGLLRPYDLT